MPVVFPRLLDEVVFRTEKKIDRGDLGLGFHCLIPSMLCGKVQELKVQIERPRRAQILSLVAILQPRKLLARALPGCPKRTHHILRFFLLDTQLLFLYIQLALKRVLILCCLNMLLERTLRTFLSFLLIDSYRIYK